VDQERQIGSSTGNEFGTQVPVARDPDGMQMAVERAEIEPIE
jgi:hypothetical protein